jgi:hypothetical protein
MILLINLIYINTYSSIIIILFNLLLTLILQLLLEFRLLDFLLLFKKAKPKPASPTANNHYCVYQNLYDKKYALVFCTLLKLLCHLNRSYFSLLTF